MAWVPDKPVSSGATGYHNAVVDAPYYIENLKELASIIRERIHDKEIVVDFGAGTGVSALCLLRDIKVNFQLWLVDNSAAWLGKAYELFQGNPRVELFLLERIDSAYKTLAETIGKNSAHHVISANTVHLIPDLDHAFAGIHEALRPKGTFVFQSGSIVRKDRDKDILMFDETVNRVHDLALDIIRTQSEFSKYKTKLQERIEEEREQRKFVFPTPRAIEEYLKKLTDSGFENITTYYKSIKIKYEDWIRFLKVHRLQAGILPEIGGRYATPEEEKTRDRIITLAAEKLFRELEQTNSKADRTGFVCEWVYISAVKI